MKKLLQIVSMLAVTGLTTSAFALISPETKKVADHMGASNLTEVKFDQTSASLTDAQKKELTNLVADARAKGEIKNIKVLAWADKEYPMPNQKAAKADIELADKRAKEIKTFMKDQLNVSDVDVYNMAERPNKVQEWLKTPAAKVKDAAENTGAAPRTKEETGIFSWKGQSSKAVAMIFTK